MSAISIVTPWLNCSELCDLYERSHGRAEIISIDNASEPEQAIKIKQMTERMGGWYIPNKKNEGFSKANNKGFKFATKNIIVFLNNDTMGAPGWIFQIEDDVRDGALYGPSLGTRTVDGRIFPYIEGWCIAATRRTWGTVGLWDENLTGMYWEDNLLCLQAMKHKINLVQTNWQVQHINNYTTNKTPGTLDHVAENKAKFEELARACQF